MGCRWAAFLIFNQIVMKFRKLKVEELGRISVDEFKKAQKAQISVVLDNIRSGLNVGSVFRTADAFRLEKIYLCGITAKPPNREINKTAIGAVDSVDWEYFKDTTSIVKQLKEQGYYIVAVEQTENSTMLQNFVPPQQPIALIFGNEVSGIQQQVIDLSDIAVEIPQFGTKHSLNISVSAGIVIWEVFKKLGYLEKL